MAQQFDLVVIGAGPGGYVAAVRAAQLGINVACIDKRSSLGGTCLNVGCIPSKALLDSSEYYYLAKNRFRDHGLVFDSVGLDIEQMLARKNDVVKSLSDGVSHLFKKNKVATFEGTAKLTGNGTVDVTDAKGKSQKLSAKSILLATGSEPAELPSLPFDGKAIVSSTEALCFDEAPEHLIVVGAGFIGLELGSVWSRLGAKVTVLEFLPRILPQCDGELAKKLQRLLKRQGLNFHLDTKVTDAIVKKGKVGVQAEIKGKNQEFQCDKVLVSVGRRPCTKDLGFEEAGIETDAKTGSIKVDKHFQTTASGIYAVGDLIAGPMLAHKASTEALALADHLAGKSALVNYDAIPSVIYTAPELASVGLTEEQLKEAGTEYKTGKFPFLASGRAKCLDETEGMIKVLADKHTDRVLGVHILGPRASDLIAEAVLAMEYSASAEDIARICHAHPTLAEGVGEAARGAWDRMLHG